MNIFYCLNESYIIPLVVSIISLFENNKDQKIVVYIFHSDFSEKSIQELDLLKIKYNQSIFCFKIESKYFKNISFKGYPIDNLYIYIFQDIIKNVDRLLYLEPDIIINKNIHSFYSKNLEENITACLNWNVSIKHDSKLRLKRINLNENGEYFIGGPILFDFKDNNEILTYNNFLKVFNENKTFLKNNIFEDVYNIMFFKKIQSLNIYENNIFITGYSMFLVNKWKYLLNKIFNYVNKKEKEKTIFFHYSAYRKPWVNIFLTSCNDVWFKYLKLSSYKDMYKKYQLKIFLSRIWIIRLFYFFCKKIYKFKK